MTTTKSTYHDVVVVDGSNIATEGRSMPSLSQLNEAVMAFRDEFPDATITVVVDATFGHRIDKSEVKQFDEAVAHNEVVAPPAGAIGRGDAFVLNIANKVGARILSNDSFQEFHGDYPWLFDEGRLIGGKPVPFVGWVFVERLPVKGPTSRKATRASRGPRDAAPVRRTASREASQPMPVPSAPPPSPRAKKAAAAPQRAARTAEAIEPTPVAPESTPTPAKPAPAAGAPVNDLMPFLDFVERHPVGSSVNGVVESYSSHGAYVQIGDLRGYVPLRLMSDPPPRSAREMMTVGDAVTLVVTSFAPARRSVDLAVPAAVPAGEIQPAPELAVIVEAVEAVASGEAPEAKPSRRGRKAAAAAVAVATEEALADAGQASPDDRDAQPAPATPARKTPARRAVAKKAPAATKTAVKKAAAATATDEVAGDETPVKKKAAAKKAPAKKAAAKKAPAKKAAAAEQPAAEPASTTTPSDGDPGAAEPTTPPDAVAADQPVTATPAKKAPAKKAPAKKTVAKQTAATKTAAKKTAAKKTAAAPERAAPTKRAAAKRSAAADDTAVSAAARRRRGGTPKEPTEG